MTYATHANFDLLLLSDTVLVIRDLGPWDRFPTVTNDAEHVVSTLHNGGLLRERRLFYVDSCGDKDELLHDGAGRFLGFKVWPR